MKLSSHHISVAGMIFYAHFLLWYIQQCKLRLPPFEQHGVAFSLVVAEGDILPVDVPVARLQLSDQRALGIFPLPKSRYGPTL